MNVNVNGDGATETNGLMNELESGWGGGAAMECAGKSDAGWEAAEMSTRLRECVASGRPRPSRAGNRNNTIRIRSRWLWPVNRSRGNVQQEGVH